jgi:hypothetical protein
MLWNPFELFKKTYDPFGENSDIYINNIDLSNTNNTARSLFVDSSIESHFRKIQNSSMDDTKNASFDIV